MATKKKKPNKGRPSGGGVMMNMRRSMRRMAGTDGARKRSGRRRGNFEQAFRVVLWIAALLLVIYIISRL